MFSTVRNFFMAGTLRRKLWASASLTKTHVVEMAWQVEAHWLWSTRHHSLQAAPAPVLIGGTGGSGTRVAARISQAAGVFMGRDLGQTCDAVQLMRGYSHRWGSYAQAGGGALSEIQREQMDRDLTASLLKHRDDIPHPGSPWGAKNPRFIFFLPHLHHCLPQVKFIHVIRDGRDIAFSKNQSQVNEVGALYLPDLEARLKTAPAPVRSIALWSQINLQVARFGRDTLGERYLQVRLEDLCADPRPVIQRIFAFLETTQPDLQAALAEVKPAASLGCWREQDPTLVSLIQREGQAGLKAFGYLDE
jgi:hypothetical protein